MSKEGLETQLDSIQIKITNTLSILRRLISHLNSLEQVITKLEADEKNAAEVADLRQVKLNLEGEVDNLIDSLGTLISEYQGFMQKSL